MHGGLRKDHAQVKANNKETCRCRRASGARWGSTQLSLSNGVPPAASRLHGLRELKSRGDLAQREEPREAHREAEQLGAGNSSSDVTRPEAEKESIDQVETR